MTILGEIVLLKLDAQLEEEINRRRADATANMDNIRETKTGFQAHVGSYVGGGGQVVMIVVKVWGDECVNGQVILDGNDSLWLQSVVRGNGLREWQPIER